VGEKKSFHKCYKFVLMLIFVALLVTLVILLLGVELRHRWNFWAPVQCLSKGLVSSLH